MIHVEHVEASERNTIDNADGTVIRADYTVTITAVVTNATDVGAAVNAVVRKIKGENHE
jgi:hypothetical protein